MDPFKVNGWDTIREMDATRAWEHVASAFSRRLPASVFRDFTPDKKVKAAPGIAPVWWSRSWIPIQADGAGNHFSIDLAPRSGPAGRVIEFWHDDVDRKVLAKDFLAYAAREVDPQL